MLELKKIKLKTKKAEGIFGMSFSMIFSIILIVFFIAVASIVITSFLKNQKCVQLNLFVKDLKREIAVARNSASSNIPFNATLPSGVEYVCLVNLTGQVNSDAIGEALFDKIQKGISVNYKDNLYIYSPSKQQCETFFRLDYVDLNTKNPNCFKVIKNKLSIFIEKRFSDPLLHLNPN